MWVIQATPEKSKEHPKLRILPFPKKWKDAVWTLRYAGGGCEPWGGIEAIPAIFSRVVLANFSVTGKLDGLFRGPRGGNLQFQFQKEKDSTPAE